VRTGRPREFCVDEVLDRAMTVFWRHGYEGASVAELTSAMGISTPSLYACFGSKEALFQAVLDRYHVRQKDFMESTLAAPTAYAVAGTFLHGVSDFAAHTGGANPPGCLLLQSGLSCTDTDIPDLLAKHRADKEAALRARFERAKKSGDLPKSASAPALARYLMVIANGICVQAAAGTTAKELHQVAELALLNWPGAANAAAAPADAKTETSSRKGRAASAEIGRP
jgi:AcrR family transcriptional regulator